jgi:alginate O-acetyltransferase complex protein AlgI
MILNSYEFALFFVIIAVGYFIMPPRFRWALLLLGSYYFFIVGSKPEYILVILLSTAVTYYCGIRIGESARAGSRKSFLITGIVVNVGLLFLFKYLNIFGIRIESVLKNVNIVGGSGELGLLVPLGISFYTLQTLSYLIDVYRGTIKPERHVGYLALYVAFFPTLLAGPIERGSHLLPQLHDRFSFDYDRVTYALKLMAWGLFLKIVIADRLGLYVNQVYNNIHGYKGLPLLFATLFFAVQIYCDFAGYTNLTRGGAKILGYDLLENFNKPYFSKNVQEFWRRWHISLTTWLRDYLYIPLGGNRVNTWRNYLNILIVFLVSGLWHSSAWTFIMWGGIHAIYYWVYLGMKQIRGTREEKQDGRILEAFKIIFTFCLVDLAWVFFRANSVSDAFYVLRNMFAFGLHDLGHLFNTAFSGYGLNLLLLVFLFVIGLISLRGSIIDRLTSKPTYIKWPVYYAFLLAMMIFASAFASQFIYIRF